MDSVPRRYLGEEHVNVDQSAQLSKLLKRIEKKKSQKHKPSKANDIDSGVDCNAEVEIDKSTNKSVSSKVITEKCEVNKSVDHVPIIGGHDFDRTKKAIAALPKWLAEPIIISTDLANLSCKVKKLNILDKLLKSHLKDNGIKYLFPVQAQVIPWLLQKQCRENSLIRHAAPRDLCVSAPTGSGKTLTYVLPVVHSLKNRFVPKIRALVVVPVQELALQVADVFNKYAKGTSLKIEVTTGGKTELSREQGKLVKKVGGVGDTLESKVDILVTTPGRLVEHLKYTAGFDVTNLKYLIIDEADRVMENVQDDWMHVLERHMNAGHGITSVVSVRTVKKRQQPQKLLFSATLSHDPEKLKQLGLFQPILFTSVAKEKINAGRTEGPVEDYVGKYTTPKELEEFYVTVPLKLKPLIVWSLVNKGWKKILCFANSVDDAHRLSKLFGLLLKGRVVKELSSKLTRKSRDETLKEFADGKIDVLVCSDVMARGVDIPGVEYVVSYDPPKHLEGYIHRVGRTGRAGSKGTALSLLDPNGQKDYFFQKLQGVNKNDIQPMVIDESQYMEKIHDYKLALSSLKSSMETESNQTLKRKKGTKPLPKRMKVKK